MKQYLHFVALLSVIILTTFQTYGQEFMLHKDSIEVDMSTYLIVPRYRTPDSDYYIKGWKNDISIGLYTNQTLPFIAPYRHNKIWAYNFHYGMFANKGINAYNNIRLKYEYGKISLENHQIAHNWQMAVDYLWDISNYYFGYKISRPWSFSLISGFNFGESSTSADTYFYQGIHVGMQARVNLTPRTYLYLEPHLSIYTNDNNNQLYKVDVSNNTYLGIGSRITSPFNTSKAIKNSTWNENFFFQYSLGTHPVLHSNNCKTEVNNHCTNVQLSIGRWFNPKLALRGTYNIESNTENTGSRMSTIAECVLNLPQTFLNKGTRFSAEFSTGIRYDQIAGIRNDWGGTTALQLKYFTNKELAFFTEGRYSSIFKDKEEEYETFTNISLGVEFYNTNFDRYKTKHEVYRQVPYRTQYYSTIGYGQLLSLGDNKNSFISNGTFNLNIGYRFNELHTFQIKSDLTRVLSQDISIHNWIMLSPQYVYNITNRWMNNSTHPFEMRAYIGPTFSLTKTQYFGHGIEMGIPIIWKLAPYFELFVEPSYKYIFLNQKEYNPSLLGLSGGFTYIQGPIYLVKHLKRFIEGDWIIAGFGGLQQDFKSFGYSGATMLPVGNLAIGRWWGPLGIRISGFSSLNRTQSPIREGLMLMAYAGGRAEGMLNLTSLFKQSEELKKFEIDFLCGYHSSLVYRPQIIYTRNWAYADGVTSAIQLKYYVYNGVGIFIEPRYTNINYERTHRQDGSTIETRQEFMDMSIGLEIRKYNSTRKDLRKTYKTFSSRPFIAGDFGYSFPFHYNGARPKSDFLKNMSPCLNLSFGYEYNATNSFRGGISYYNLRSMFSNNDEVGLAACVEYMPNLTNTMLGYNPTRIIDVSGIIGTNLLYSTYKEKLENGIHGGAQLSFHLSKDINILIEGKLAAYYKPSIVARMRTVRNIGIMPTISSGITFKL